MKLLFFAEGWLVATAFLLSCGDLGEIESAETALSEESAGADETSSCVIEDEPPPLVLGVEPELDVLAESDEASNVGGALWTNWSGAYGPNGIDTN